jgi:hypothetical protein
MTLFFFNFWDHNTYVVDPKGVELPNPNAVREQALKAARQIVDDGIAHGDDRSGWKFDIKDSSDRTVLTLPFAEAMLGQPRADEDERHATRRQSVDQAR